MVMMMSNTSVREYNKFRNTRVEVDGYWFDSKAEAARYKDLKLLEQGKEIRLLQVHPRYELQPPFVDNDGKKQRSIVYEADFSYIEGEKRVVEDVKGAVTKDYALKAKLFRYRYSSLVYRVLKVR
jgi:hypothetical protein